MSFKRFLLSESPDNLFYNDRKFVYYDQDNVPIGVFNNEVIFINSPGDMATSVIFNNKKYTKKEFQQKAKEILLLAKETENQPLVYLMNEIIKFPDKTHGTLILLYLILKSYDKKLDKETLNKIFEHLKLVQRAKGYMAKAFTLSARLWINKGDMVISFWETPTKKDINLICNALKLNPKQITYEIPVGVVSREEGEEENNEYKLFKYDEITGNEPRVEVDHEEHTKSPMLKKKKEVAPGWGSKKDVAGQKPGEVTAQARARLQTSEEAT
jgi:hypothetical protein